MDGSVGKGILCQARQPGFHPGTHVIGGENELLKAVL